MKNTSMPKQLPYRTVRYKWPLSRKVYIRRCYNAALHELNLKGIPGIRMYVVYYKRREDYQMVIFRFPGDLPWNTEAYPSYKYVQCSTPAGTFYPEIRFKDGY